MIQPTSALSMKASASTTGPFSSFVSFAADAGDSALSRVQWLGSRVAEKEGGFEQSRNRRNSNAFRVDGIGGSVINNQRRQLLEYQESFAQQNSELPDKFQTYVSQNPAKERQVWEALANLEQDSKFSRVVYFGFVICAYVLECLQSTVAHDLQTQCNSWID